MTEAKINPEKKIEFVPVRESDVVQVFVNGHFQASILPTPTGIELLSEHISALRFREGKRKGVEVDFDALVS